MINKIFRSQNGFSIIQGMILASVVAGMALVGTKVITDQKLAQKGVESRSRLEQLHSMIFSIMQNKDHCTRTFAANSISPAASTSVTLPSIWTNGATQAVFVNKSVPPYARYMNNSVTINGMTIDFPAALNQHASLKIKYGKLDETDAQAKTGRGYGAKEFQKTIKLKIQRHPTTSAFESCYAVDEAENQDMIKNFCEGLGSDNNPATANLFNWDYTAQRCVLNDLNCPTGKVFTGYDANGLRQCYAIKDWMNFGSLIESTLSTCNAGSSNDVKFVLSGGKAQVSCAP